MAKILVAEDSTTEMEVIKRILQGTHHMVLTAENGQEAAEKAKAESIDLLILDIVMPKKNGYEVCRELRADSAMKDLSIIMVSSKNLESDRAWGLKQGADEYITKPYAPLDLLVAVKKHLKRPR